MIGPIELAELGAAALLIFGLKVPEYAPGPRWARGRTLAGTALAGTKVAGMFILDVLAGTRDQRNVCARCGHTRFQHGPRGGPCCGPECAAANAGYMRGGESGCAKFLANAAEEVARLARAEATGCDRHGDKYSEGCGACLSVLRAIYERSGKDRAWLVPCAGCGDLESEHNRGRDLYCEGPKCRAAANFWDNPTGKCTRYRRPGD